MPEITNVGYGQWKHLQDDRKNTYGNGGINEEEDAIIAAIDIKHCTKEDIWLKN